MDIEMKKYFVSYYFKQGFVTGFGNSVIDIEHGMIDGLSVKHAEDAIKRDIEDIDLNSNVVILFFREFDDPDLE